MKKLIAFVPSWVRNPFSVPWWIKAPVASIGFVIGCYVAIENWVISKAVTVVEPIRVQVTAQDKTLIEIAERTRNIEKILMERN